MSHYILTVFTPSIFGCLSSLRSLISLNAVRLIPSAASVRLPYFIYKILILKAYIDDITKL